MTPDLRRPSPLPRRSTRLVPIVATFLLLGAPLAHAAGAAPAGRPAGSPAHSPAHSAAAQHLHRELAELRADRHAGRSDTARGPRPVSRSARPTVDLSPARARALGRQMMHRYWPDRQWPYLERLWTRESNWTYRATNPTSGAYGIPQSLPAGRMRTAGADWRTNARTQIAWGLAYIKHRYGTPAAALAHHLRKNWY